MPVIPSEAQAERLGEQRTGGKRGEDFVVFRYEQRPSRLTLFAVEIKETKEIIWSL